MGQRKWFVVLSFHTVAYICCETLGLPVQANHQLQPAVHLKKKSQASKAFDHAEFSDEISRPHKGLEFPNTAFIPGDLTEQLGVDNFFSLWFVFLDDDVFTSDKNFTILAPINWSPTRPLPTMEDKERVRRLLLNHIILGKSVTSSDLRQSLTLTSLGGNSLHFKSNKDGKTVNGVSILKSDVQVPHGMILVLDDYLFIDQYHGDVQASASDLGVSSRFSAIPMTSSSEGGIPMIELGTHDHPDSNGHHHIDGDLGNTSTPLAHRQTSFNATRPFYEELVEVLSFLRSGTSNFLKYLEQVNISEHFTPDQEYTAFVPMDDSFAQWYPIDWGFNPFVVDEFVNETMINHFVMGKHTQSSLKEGAVLTTLGGKTLVVSRKPKLSINDIEVFVGDTPVSRGNIQFIGDILFVDYNVVNELRGKHRDVESAPMVLNPWPWSLFLSHTYNELNGRGQFSFVFDYVNRTSELSEDLPSHDNAFTMLTYTFFLPKDEAFSNLLPQDTADPFIIDSKFRHETLLGHLVNKRIYAKELIHGQEFQTVNNRTIRISREGNVTKVNDATILESDIFIYNLGTVFVIDRVLFVDHKAVNEVLALHAHEIPSFGLQFASSTPPRAVEDSTTVIDIIAELIGEGTTTSLPDSESGQVTSL